MVYEPSQHDENVTPDNIVRSQFGTPRVNGSGSAPGAQGEVPEAYRFDPTRPRQRRHAVPEDTQPVNTQDTASQAAPIPRQTTPDNTPTQWTAKHTEPVQRYSVDPTTPVKRGSRAERRRAAEQSTPIEDTDNTTRTSDLDRIANFLRSTQQAAEDDPEPTAEAPQATPERDDSEKTSELPTVTPPEKSVATVDSTASGHEVLAAIRRIPGVNDAHMSDADSRLALDIADDADAESVHAQVLELLDQRLGMQAQAVAKAPETVEAEPEPERSATPLPPGSRVILERTQVITSGFEAAVEVGLTVNGARAVGRSTCPAVDWHILRGAADATVDAVGILLGKDARVVVEHASVEKAGSGRVAVVMVLLLTEAGTEQLAGAAPVDGDRRQAVVHATLQALNRRLEAMFSG